MSVQLGPEWQQLQRRLAASPTEYEHQIRQTLQASLLLIETDARQLASRDTGRLGASINGRIEGAYPALTGRVGPSVNYGAFVEFGRRAGARMPPVDALLGWVRRHWSPAFVGPLRQGQLRPRRAAGRNVSDAQIRSRAFALARAIARRGIPAHPFLQPAYAKNQARIVAGFAAINIRMTAYFAGRPL